MRSTVHWLFVVSVALFVSGIAFVVAAGRSARQPAPAAVEAPATVPVATVRQIMAAITQPAATAIYGAVGTIMNAEGVKEIAPETDEDWASLAGQAAALIESGNLILMGDRPIDQGDWVKMTQALMDGGRLALEAAEGRSTSGILEAGDVINRSCDTCHERYQRQ